ncbi:hypothetical protein NX059_009611 [Plenodomus lindquistii]|nr:hypothetical protein NX059_009611 [Plenodomus lindquistii]
MRVPKLSTLLILPAMAYAQVNPPQVKCGTLTMANGSSKALISGACWPIGGEAKSAEVDSAYTCNFSAWDTCDAGKHWRRAITGVPVAQAKGYWCSKIDK